MPWPGSARPSSPSPASSSSPASPPDASGERERAGATAVAAGGDQAAAKRPTVTFTISGGPGAGSYVSDPAATLDVCTHAADGSWRVMYGGGDPWANVDLLFGARVAEPDGAGDVAAEITAGKADLWDGPAPVPCWRRQGSEHRDRGRDSRRDGNHLPCHRQHAEPDAERRRRGVHAGPDGDLSGLSRRLGPRQTDVGSIVRRPGKREKSRSTVASVAPCSSVSAAR